MVRRSKRWAHRRYAVRRPNGHHAIPGTIRVDPEAPQSAVTLIAYGPDLFEEKAIGKVSEIAAWRDRASVLWINVDGLGSADVLMELGKMFHLHPLALEDVANTHQRAKCDDYGDVLFCVARMVQGPPLVSEQISFFVGNNFVITFQEDQEGDSLDPVRQRLRQNCGRIRPAGPDYLFYELLDSVIEGYFPVLEGISHELDELDRDDAYRNVGRQLSSIHQLRGDLLYLRRIVWPHRDALQSLMRGGHRQIQQETQLYLRDCYDHVTQLIDILEIYRENCSDLREFFYTRLSNRTNEIMRVLTIISTVFLPMTFVAGVYGMNFDYMPELHWSYGYPFSLVIMGAIAVGFLVFFYRRGWLQGADITSDNDVAPDR